MVTVLVARMAWASGRRALQVRGGERLQRLLGQLAGGVARQPWHQQQGSRQEYRINPPTQLLDDVRRLERRGDHAGGDARDIAVRRARLVAMEKRAILDACDRVE